MEFVARATEKLNFKLPGARWHLFEWCDLWFVPPVVVHCCQETLTAQWSKRIPFLQQQAPAELAAAVLAKALEDTAGGGGSWTVVDFCSGAGGPVPLIEKHVNRGRRDKGLRPIPFRLSDLHPNLDAWMEHASRSDHLSFVPQPTDARNPPFSVISATTPGDREAAAGRGFEGDGHKVFRLYCLSFHHFKDEEAKRVMKSTLETSDAFAIFELQDRNVVTLLFMLLEYWLLLLVTMFWFWHDWRHLILTYGMPLLPAVQCFDGFVSCLRTRTFDEILRLVANVQGGDDCQVENAVVAHRKDWMFQHVRRLHTWPVGYMNATIGTRRKSSIKEMKASA